MDHVQPKACRYVQDWLDLGRFLGRRSHRERATLKIVPAARWRGLDEAAAQEWTMRSPKHAGMSKLGWILGASVAGALIESAPPALVRHLHWCATCIGAPPAVEHHLHWGPKSQPAEKPAFA